MKFTDFKLFKDAHKNTCFSMGGGAFVGTPSTGTKKVFKCVGCSARYEEDNKGRFIKGEIKAHQMAQVDKIQRSLSSFMEV